jgi:transcriptional regulator with XRE-family HTH domain
MPVAFGTELKHWRGVRRMSQLELANLAEVSSRHISFIESGRSAPSRTMVLHLGEALQMPRSARNQLLASAGFAPSWSSAAPDDDTLRPILDAEQWMLERHDPYPGLVLDQHWNVVDANSAGRMMLAVLGIEIGASALDAFIDPHGISTQIENWPEVGWSIISRLRTESAWVGGDEILDAAIATLGADERLGSPPQGPLPAVISSRVKVGDLTMSLFSTIAQFGSVEDIALADHRVELYFPADDATRELLIAMHESM